MTGLTAEAGRGRGAKRAERRALETARTREVEAEVAGSAGRRGRGAGRAVGRALETGACAQEERRLTAEALSRVAVETVRVGGGAGGAEVGGVSEVSVGHALSAVGAAAAGEAAVDGREAAEALAGREVVLCRALLAGVGVGAQDAGGERSAAKGAEVGGGDEVVLIGAREADGSVGALSAADHVSRAHSAGVRGVHVFLSGAELLTALRFGIAISFIK